MPFGCGPCGEVQRTSREGEEAAATSIIRIIQEVHGREVMPPDGWHCPSRKCSGEAMLS